MYTETTGLLFPFFQNFSPESLHFDDFCRPQKPNSCLSNLVQGSSTSGYDMTAESDLFKAPEPMIDCEDNIIESLQSDPVLSEMFNECRKDLLEKSALDITPSDVLDMKMTPLMPINENESPCDVFQKSVSSECLRSMKWDRDNRSTPFMEFEASGFGIRRSFSDGDIKTLGVVSSTQLQPSVGFSNCSAEERREKLSRYRNKKTKRNFGRNIKYACRKALADNQPRIRGRFAKTEETDGPKKV